MRSALTTMLIVLSIIPIITVGATSGQIADIQIEQTPTDNETVKVTITAFVEVQFDSSGVYQLVVRDSEENEIASSLIYRVGVTQSTRMILLTFERPRSPGIYTYSLVLRVKETEGKWFVADTVKLIFDVLPPEVEETNQTQTTNTATNTTTATQCEITVTKAYVENITVTTTVTETNLTNMSTTTVAVTRYLERWKTITTTVTETTPVKVIVTVTREKTKTVVGIPEEMTQDYFIPLVTLLGIIVLSMILFLWMRRKTAQP